MPNTNENLSPALVANILANGYTPRTPEEWIMSALNYLDVDAVQPPIGGGGGGSGDFKADGSVPMTGTLASREILPTADATYNLGSATFAYQDVYVAGQILVDTIAEKTGAAGITISNTLFTSVISASSGSFLSLQNFATTGSIIINNAGFIGAEATVNQDISLRTTGTGEILADSDDGIITLTPDTGWTACTGTENKAGLDANNVIFTVGALQDLARTVAALQNVLILKGYLVA